MRGLLRSQTLHHTSGRVNRYTYSPIGIIFTGGPNSVYLDTSPHVDPDIFTWGVPILGICYGCQLMAHSLGGLVTPAQEDTAREYGKTATQYDTSFPLFQGLPTEGISWMSHGDYMAKVPEGVCPGRPHRHVPHRRHR